MDPTRMNATALNSSNLNEFRYYPIDPMTTPISCNITANTSAEALSMAGFGLTGTTTTALLPTAIATPSGSLLHVIPLQMTPHGVGGITTANTTSASASVVPQMAIIAPTTPNATSALAQNNANLDYYRVQQQLQGVAPTTTTFTVLVNDAVALTDNAKAFVGGQLEMEKTGNGSQIAITENVSMESTETTKAATFVLPATTIATNVAIANEEFVKRIIGAEVGDPSTDANSLSFTTNGTATVKVPRNKQQDLQQQQHHHQKAQTIQKQKVINSSLQQAVQRSTTKSLPTIPKMLASNNCNNNCLDQKTSSSFVQPSVEGAACKSQSTSIAAAIHNPASTLLPVDSSVVTQISNSVTLSLAKPSRTAGKKSCKRDRETACVTLEKSNPSKENPHFLPNCTKATVIKPQRTYANCKQKSLLKSKPAPHNICENTSPRTKRSKSLNNNVAFMEDLGTERRRSTASEGKATLQRSPDVKRPSINIEKAHTDEEREKIATKDEAAPSAQSKSVEFEADYLVEENQSAGDGNGTDFPKEFLQEKHKEEEDEEEEKEEKGSERPTEIEEKSESVDNLKLNEQPEYVDVVSPSKKRLILSCENEEKQTLSSEMSLLTIKEETPPDNDEEQQPATMSKRAELNTSNNRSLLCDERILVTSSYSASTSSASVNDSVPHESSSDIATNSTLLTIAKSSTVSHGAKCAASTDINSYSTVLEMLSTFNMLSWKERIGTARCTNLRFQLNEFNLLQIHERCPPRYNIHTAYEKPIYERETHSLENSDPLLYLCRRCNCHGPAAEFLAPEFCSVECLKRDSRKRQRDIAGITSRKRPRKEVLVCGLQASVNRQQAPPPTGTAITQSTSSLLVKKFFRWSTYLTGRSGEIAAPVDLFLNPFPTGPNNFQIGMKLEAIDPENCSLFCVCTVTDIQGYRLNLTFDGYDRMYNFWINADSMDIFPPGWCAKTNRILQPPRGVEATKFNWPAYFAREKAVAAPRQLFTHLNSSASPMRNPFKIGMHLEAEDLNDTGKLCVATISDVLDDRIRVHFDGWDDCYDYWVDINSPYIHPCGWHEGRQQLIVPPDFENSAFSWSEYLRDRGPGTMAPPSLFSARDPIDFKPKMKLEVVDPRNPILIRPATVIARKGHRIKLHLDLWPNEYCFWLEDDSPDLHPIGWCDATGHDLEPPPGYQARPALMPCSVMGCRGIGNARRCNLSTHSTLESCPYAPENWSIKLEKLPRVESHDIERKVTAKAAHSEQQNILNRPRNEFRTRRSNEQKYTISKSANSTCGEDTANRANLLDTVKTRRSLQEQQQATSQQLQQIDIPGGGALEKFLAIKHEQDFAMAENVIEETATGAVSKLKITSVISGDTLASDPCSLRIAREYLCDYGPRLHQNYNIWQQNLNANYDHIKTNPLQWSTSESSSFVEKLLNCSKTASVFMREDIDGAALLDLQQSDLTDILELKLGKAVKLFAHILQLRTWAVAKFDVKIIESNCN